MQRFWRVLEVLAVAAAGGNITHHMNIGISTSWDWVVVITGVVLIGICALRAWINPKRVAGS